MHNPIRIIRSFGIYLLPASSLAVATVLLLGLLYYPTPVTVSSTQPQAIATTEHPDWRSHADALFAALLADALRQLQAEQETQVRTLRYQYEQDHSSGESPVTLWMTSPPATGADCEVDRPALIQL